MWVKGSSLDIGRYHIAVPHFDIAVLMVPGYGLHHGVSNNMQDHGSYSLNINRGGSCVYLVSGTLHYSPE